MDLRTTPILDDTIRGNQSPAGTSSSGAVWSAFSGYAGLGLSLLQIISNAITGAGAAGNGYLPIAFARDSEAHGILSVLPADGTFTDLALRLHDDAGGINGVDGYAIRLSKVAGAGNNDTIQLIRITNFSATTVGTAFSGFELVAGRRYGVTCFVDVFVIWYQDGSATPVVIGQTTDSTYTSGGYIGLTVVGTTARWTSIGGGNITKKLVGNATINMQGLGTINRTAHLIGSAQVVLQGLGAMTRYARLSANAPVTVSAAGTPQRVAHLAGNAPLAITGAGTMNRVAHLGGNTSVALQVSGIPNRIAHLVGNAQITFLVNGEPVTNIEGVNLSGNAPITIVVNGIPSRSIHLAASAQIGVTATGLIKVIRQLAGQATIGVRGTGSIRVFDDTIDFLDNEGVSVKLDVRGVVVEMDERGVNVKYVERGVSA